MTETHLPATRRGPGSGHDGPRLAGGRHLPQPRPIPGAAAGRPQQGPSVWATAPGRPQPWCHRAAPAGASAAGTRCPACGVTTGPATTMHPHVFRWGGDGPVTHVLPTTWNRPASPADEGPALPSGPRPGRARGHSWTPVSPAPKLQQGQQAGHTGGHSRLLTDVAKHPGRRGQGRGHPGTGQQRWGQGPVRLHLAPKALFPAFPRRALHCTPRRHPTGEQRGGRPEETTPSAGHVERRGASGLGDKRVQAQLPGHAWQAGPSHREVGPAATAGGGNAAAAVQSGWSSDAACGVAAPRSVSRRREHL